VCKLSASFNKTNSIINIFHTISNIKYKVFLIVIFIPVKNLFLI
jgi:hypothetical protein